MNLFDFVPAQSIDEAVSAAASPGTVYLAGGTNLIDLMKAGARRPDRIVDIGRIDSLKQIEALDDGGFRIGALVRNSDLAGHEAFAATFPAVSEALLSGASGQLRNAATVGGNLMQQPRCSYFYDQNSACNRRGGDGCDAIGGETAKHAVLGWSDQCIAVHPSDFCVPLAALGARVEVAGPDGTRDLAIDDLYALPDKASPGGATLRPGELITAVTLPGEAKRFAPHARYIKVRDRTSYAFALVSAAAMIERDGDTIGEARLALGGVAAKPWRAREAEALLAGAPATADTFETAAERALAEATPSGDNAYKIDLARRLIVKALRLAAAGTPPSMPALPGSVFNPNREPA